MGLINDQVIGEIMKMFEDDDVMNRYRESLKHPLRMPWPERRRGYPVNNQQSLMKEVAEAVTTTIRVDERILKHTTDVDRFQKMANDALNRIRRANITINPTTGYLERDASKECEICGHPDCVEGWTTWPEPFNSPYQEVVTHVARCQTHKLTEQQIEDVGTRFSRYRNQII